MFIRPRTIHVLAKAKREYQSRPLGPADIEIKISHCGICGSDLHTIDNGWGPSMCICANADGLFLSFLAVRDSCIMVGLPNDDIKFNAFGVVGKGAKFVGSNIASIQDIKDILELENVHAVIQKKKKTAHGEDGWQRHSALPENHLK